METEKRLKYLLDEIVELNDFIERGREAIEKRNKLRKEVAKIMECYAETVNEMS